MLYNGLRLLWQKYPTLGQHTACGVNKAYGADPLALRERGLAPPHPPNVQNTKVCRGFLLFGLDSFHMTATSLLVPFVTAGKNFTCNYRRIPDRLSTPTSGGLPLFAILR